MNPARWVLAGIVSWCAPWPASIGAQESAAGPCCIAVPAAFAASVAPVLAQRFGARAVVLATPSVDATPPVAAHVLLLHDEWTLARLAATGALLPVPGSAATPGAPRPTYELPFCTEVTAALAVAAGVVDASDQAITWERLAMAPELHDRLGLVGPEIDGAPWLQAMRQAMRHGEREDAGIALWTTLDARAGRLFDDYDRVLASLANGTLAAGIGPRALFAPVVARSSGRLRLLPVAGTGSVGLGMAVTTGAGQAALEVAALLREPACLQAIADAVGVAHNPPGPAFLDGEAAGAWWARFARDVRGRGRDVERIADWLDFVFAVLFVVFGLLLWRSLRREPAPTG